MSSASLPMDIFVTIFEMLRSSIRDNDAYHNAEADFQSPKTDLSLCWVSEVTHVCHSWREAALFASFLWTDIDVEASPLWAAEFARRSRQCPISVILESYRLLDDEWTRHPKAYECTKTLLHENRHRIRKIRLEDVDDESFVTSALSHEMGVGPGLFPILESLEINFRRTRDVRASFLLTNSMLRAPTMRKLSLRGCSVEEDFGSFHKLSFLSITSDTSPIVTAKFLRRALSEMFNLERLIIKRDFELTPPSEAVYFGNQLAILPNLDRIEIEDWPFQWVISILEMISYEQRRYLWLSGVCLDRLDQYCQLVNRIMLHVKNPRIRLLSISLTDPMEFIVWASEYCYENIRLGVKFLPVLEVSQSHPQDPTHMLLDAILLRIDAQELQKLDLLLKKPLAACSWIELFGKLPSLDGIRIFWGVREFFAALGQDVSEDVSEHTGVPASVPFQALKKLMIVGRSDPYSEEDIQIMFKCLQKRKELGFRLEELHFMTGVLDQSLQLGVLRSVVGMLNIR